MKYLKPMIAICLLLALICCFAACRRDNDDLPSQSETDESDEVISDQKLYLVKDGEATSQIILPESAMVMEGEAAVLFRNIVKNATSVNLSSGTDYVSWNTSRDEAAVEILIGLTDYTQTAEVLSTLSYGDYAVRVVGNKLVAVGYSQEASRAAVLALRNVLENSLSEDGKSLAIDRALDLRGTIFDGANSLPHYEGSATECPVLSDCGDNALTLTVRNTTPEEFSAYGEVLEKGGYAGYDAYRILESNSLYASYLNGTYQATTVYMAQEKTAKVIIEPIAGTEPVAKTASAFKKVCEPLLLQVGVVNTELDSQMNGMGYIYRLSDGSFLIVDGGYDDEKHPKIENGKRIYELLKEYAPDSGHIVIAAWIVTHAHVDHMGAIDYFSRTYLNDPAITMERVIWNVPALVQSTQVNTGSMVSKLEEYRRNIIPRLEKANVKIVKAHPGQHFLIRDAVVDVLYTYELTAPEALTDFNTSSVVTRITLGGKSTLMTGDASGTSAETMIRMYGDYLKSDILQVPHHGLFDGGTKNFYAKVDADIILWPVATSHYVTVRNSRAHLTYFSGYVNYYTEQELAERKGEVTVPDKIILVGGWLVTKIDLSADFSDRNFSYIHTTPIS